MLCCQHVAVRGAQWDCPPREVKPQQRRRWHQRVHATSGDEGAPDSANGKGEPVLFVSACDPVWARLYTHKHSPALCCSRGACGLYTLSQTGSFESGQAHERGHASQGVPPATVMKRKEGQVRRQPSLATVTIDKSQHTHFHRLIASDVALNHSLYLFITLCVNTFYAFCLEQNTAKGVSSWWSALPCTDSIHTFGAHAI